MNNPNRETQTSTDGRQNARAAVGSSVVLFDVSDRTQIEITGADRARFLHSFASNDIKKLKPGSGCETFLTNIKGRVVAHVYAFCSESSLWLDGTAGQQECIISHLKKFVLIDDVQLIPRSEERGELYITGPWTLPLLQLDESMKMGESVHRENEGQSFLFRRVDLFGVAGCLMSIPRSQIDGVKTGLLAAGVTQGTREDFEFLRIQSGYPSFGVDFTEDYLAQEVARTPQCISFNKGCYLGQETIARLDSVGHTNRELRRLQFDSPCEVTSGTTVYDSSGMSEVGHITSSITDGVAPAGRTLAIGTLKRVVCQPGTEISLKVDSSKITGKVLPAV